MNPASSSTLRLCPLEDRARANFVDFGLGSYEEVLELQGLLRWARGENRIGDVWLAGEHPTVITQGVRGKSDDVIGPVGRAGDEPSSQSSPRVFLIDRGGMTTLHSPGQLILYPVVKLGGGSLAAARFSNALLRSMRDWIGSRFGVASEKISGSPGLYVGGRKLLSIGISVRGGISMHGIALNLSNDLGLWSSIVACGEPEMKPISIAEIAGQRFEVRDQMGPLAEWLAEVWGYTEVARPEFAEFRAQMKASTVL